MTIKYSTYDSSSGNAFSVISITGASGTFTSGISGTVYKASGNVTIITGSGDIRPFGTFSFPASVGSSGQYLLNNGNNTTSWGALPGYVLDFQEYSGNSTWTKPSGASVVYVELVGGGAGGGAGARFATTSIRNGGGGGAAGVYVWKLFMATDLSGSVPITIGAGGSGGVATTGDTQPGFTGNNGGNTSFGSYLYSDVSSGGIGGANVSTISGGRPSYRGAVGFNAASGGNGTTTSGGSVSGAYVGGGGGGASANASSLAPSLGGSGGVATAFTVSGTRASSDENAVANEGGGGGGGSYQSGTTGTNGGNGAYPGGGGGGGSASDNGFNSGAGGNGGGGMIRVWTW